MNIAINTDHFEFKADQEKSYSQVDKKELYSIANTVTKLIAPSWPLADFVAVNPLWGFKDRPFLSTQSRLRSLIGSGILPSTDFFLNHFEKNNLQESEINNVLLEAKLTGNLDNDTFKANSELLNSRFLAALNNSKKDKTDYKTPTFSEYLETLGLVKNIDGLFIDEISKFCGIYFDKGQAAFKSPLQELSLFKAWNHLARTDRTLNILGFSDFKSFLEKYANEYEEILFEAYKILDYRKDILEIFLELNLFSIKGWSSYVRHLAFEDEKTLKQNDTPLELLCIKIAYEIYLIKKAPIRDVKNYINLLKARISIVPNQKKDSILYLSQLILERRFIRSLAKNIAPAALTPYERKTMQAIFCIDVRSENFRNNLEQQSDNIETYGFAGFFGLCFNHCQSDYDYNINQYPALLSTRFKIKEKNSLEEFKTNSLNALIKSLRQSVCSGFSYVEGFGLYYLYEIAKDVLRVQSPESRINTAPQLELELTLEQKVEASINLLKNSGLRIPYAPTVLLCGHESSTNNNPFQSALDCGACGGHSGGINALVASRILNDQSVRESLLGSEYEIPVDTVFVPAVHCTTTDEIHIIENDKNLDNEKIAWLQSATELSIKRRSAAIGLEQSESILKDVSKRAQDWSEVRPEWGLAGNAAFIAARRSRTKKSDLAGRCFLHEYDSESDPQDKILELIMTAPMIVASWINLQYYTCATTPEFFGAGNKTIHNVVGQLGVLEGNSGDLKIGLPMQSVHDGKKSMHEPLRLQVIIEAQMENITKIVEKHDLLNDLINNGWLKIFSLSRESNEMHQLVRNEVWYRHS